MDEPMVGYRFYPTEAELVSFYLPNMIQGRRQDMHRVIPVINVFENEPWELPNLAGDRCRTDTEQWFFFVPRQEREVRGGRPSRTTSSGYWKATGSPSYVFSSENRIIGIKKMMVFYRGKAPTGRKTDWKMNEYKAFDGEVNNMSNPKLRHEYSLCRIYVTSGDSRAFDRRPTGACMRQVKLPSDGGASTSSHVPAMPEKASSSQSLYSGEDWIQGNTRQTNSDMVDCLELPVWEWEKLNWP